MADPEFDDLDLNYTPWLPADRAAAILDVGCGSGRVLAFLRAKGYRQIEGFDCDAETVAAARTRVSAPIAVEHDWERYLAGRAGAFDLVVLKDVIYYVPIDRVVEALCTIRAALKPGGRVILEVFNGVSYTGPFIAYKDEAIRWTPTEHTIQRFLTRAGFVDVTLRAQLPPSPTWRRRLFNLVGRAWRLVLRTLYVIERGLAEENPKIFSTKIIAVAAGSAPVR